MTLKSDFENWDRLQALFHLAEDVPDADLDALLLGASADPELRRRARALIAAERTGAGGAAVGTAAGPVSGSVSWGASPSGSGTGAGIGSRIGPYSILGHLGSGGIGAVYLVERIAGGAVQRAALKVLSLHAAGPSFLERFAREQHILASLDHPHITRMIDAGMSDTGLPYLVMEFVDGLHLDTYCDDRSLGIAARLKLFLQVCDAVAYAHRNLVVHLDLKPSNILVANSLVISSLATVAEGCVKLLDFGTSKLIRTDSLLTTTVMATPAYASPEQLRNEAVTTACDIYALGAILFELLAGRRPNQDSSVAIMIERSIKELPPEPLTEAVTATAAEVRGLTETRLRSRLQGDLATIVAKCLNPRPGDRYPSVDALITDLERNLAGRPILARPQTTSYKIGKFVRRNRKSVIAATLAILALTATTGYGLVRQEEALREGRRALQMQNFLIQLFRLANSDYTGKPTATVPEFLQIGVRVLPEFIPHEADRRAAQLSLAEAMVSNGDLHDAEPNLAAVIANAKAARDLPVEAEAEATLGQVKDTLGNNDDALALSAHALSLAHAPGVTPSARVAIEGYYAQIREDRQDQTEENLQLLEAAVGESRSRHLPKRQLATQIDYLALALEGRGRLDEADALLRESLTIYQSEPYATCDEGLVYRFMGHIRSQMQDYQGSANLYQKAYDRLRACSGDSSQETLAVEGYLANAMLKLGRPGPVVTLLEASLPKWRAAIGADSQSMATPLLFLTRAYIANGQFSKAEPTAEELLRVLRGKINAHSSTMGVCQEAWAQALAGEHRYPEAIAHAQQAVDAFPAQLNPGEIANLEKARHTLSSIQTAAQQAPQQGASADRR